MKKINLALLLKNISAILCGLFFASLLLPFVSFTAKANVAGASAESSSKMSGIQLVTGSGVFGILLVLMPIAILLFTYIAQLEKFKKPVCMGASIGMVAFVIICSFTAKAGEVSSGPMTLQSHRLIGFWLMLIISIALTAISALSFFKKIEVSDIISGQISEEGKEDKESVPKLHIDKDKIAGITKNITDTVSEQGKMIGRKISETSKTSADKAEKAGTQSTTQQSSSHLVAPIEPQPAVQAAPQPKPQSPKERPEVVMEQLKKLNELKVNGILTQEEFDEKKAELLKRF